MWNIVRHTRGYIDYDISYYCFSKFFIKFGKKCFFMFKKKYFTLNAFCNYDSVNIGISVGFSFLSCVQDKQHVMYVFQVQRPPSWIFHFRLHLAVSPVMPLEWLSTKMG